MTRLNRFGEPAKKASEGRGGMKIMLREKIAREHGRATELAREIHQVIKRGPATEDHGLIGNLKCILDHVCSKNDPKP